MFLVLIVTIPHAYAFETEFPVDPASKKSFAQPEDIGISLLTVQPNNKQIVCFDVSSEGCIALGLKEPFNPSRCFVNVYTNEGGFLVSLQFECDGTFYVEAQADRVNIYCLRGDYLMSIPLTVGPCEIWSVRNKYVTSFLSYLKSPIRDRNGIQYKLEKDFSFLYNEQEYSRLSIQKPSGELIIIYDASIFLNRSIIVRLVIFIFLFATSLIALISYIAQTTRRQKSDPLDNFG